MKLAITCNTVEPLNKGHFGNRASVLYSEVVLWWEVQLNLLFLGTSSTQIPTKCVLKHKTSHLLYPAGVRDCMLLKGLNFVVISDTIQFT